MPAGTLRELRRASAATSAWQAIAQSGVFSDGFQTTGSPQTQREHGVPGPDGDGKVERRDDADRAERMPLLHQAMAGPLAGDRQAVELPAEADGEVADVDHLLHFAEGFLRDLAGFPADDRGQVGLVTREAARRMRRTNSPRTGAGTMRHCRNAAARGVDRRRRPGRRRRRELGQRAAVDRRARRSALRRRRRAIGCRSRRLQPAPGRRGGRRAS